MYKKYKSYVKKKENIKMSWRLKKTKIMKTFVF